MKNHILPRSITVGIVLFLSFFSLCAKEVAKNTWTDAKGDFSYKDRPNPSMDIREFSIVRTSTKSLQFSVLMDAPVVTEHVEKDYDKKDTLSIYLYIDMDQDSKTGTRLRTIGHDITIQMYFSRSDDEWRLDLDDVWKPYSEESIDLKDVDIDENRITFELKSKNFDSDDLKKFDFHLYTHSDRNSWVDKLSNKKHLTYDEGTSTDLK